MQSFSRNDRSQTNNLNYHLGGSSLSNKRDLSPRPYGSNLGNKYQGLDHNFGNHRTDLNKTQTSVHSEHLWNTLHEIELFPAELS